jgi:hypothetical protein
LRAAGRWPAFTHTSRENFMIGMARYEPQDCLLSTRLPAQVERHCARKKEGTMDRNTIEPAIKMLLTEIHAKLNEATRIAKAAEACALAGSVAEGVTVSMDIEQLIHEADRLQGSASLLNRLSRE